MNISPLQKVRTPKYPTLNEMASRSDYLLTHLPARWKSNRMIAAALSTFLALSEMGNAAANTNEKNASEQLGESKKDNRNDTGKESILRSAEPMTAPIFMHGDGRGAAGCVVIAPPVFISEDEARTIIKEQFEKFGILFDEQDVKLQEGLYLDCLSSKQQIGFVFTSASDHDRWKFKSSTLSSVKNYNILKLAQKLQRKIKRNRKYTTAVFYDPMVRTFNAAGCCEENYEAYRRARESGIDDARTRARTLLEWQVKDFVGWLACNGYLKLESGKKQ